MKRCFLLFLYFRLSSLAHPQNPHLDGRYMTNSITHELAHHHNPIHTPPTKDTPDTSLGQDFIHPSQQYFDTMNHYHKYTTINEFISLCQVHLTSLDNHHLPELSRDALEANQALIKVIQTILHDLINDFTLIRRHKIADFFNSSPHDFSMSLSFILCAIRESIFRLDYPIEVYMDSVFHYSSPGKDWALKIHYWKSFMRSVYSTQLESVPIKLSSWYFRLSTESLKAVAEVRDTNYVQLLASTSTHTGNNQKIGHLIGTLMELYTCIDAAYLQLSGTALVSLVVEVELNELCEEYFRVAHHIKFIVLSESPDKAEVMRFLSLAVSRLKVMLQLIKLV